MLGAADAQDHAISLNIHVFSPSSLLMFYNYYNGLLVHTEFGQNPLLVLALFAVSMILLVILLRDVNWTTSDNRHRKDDEDLTWRDVPDTGSSVEERQEEDDDENLWRVPDESIHMYVESLLNDPKINVGWIPDSLERSMYSYTVSLGVQVFYKAFVGGLKNIKVFNHSVNISVKSTKKLEIHDDLNVEFSRQRIELIVNRLIQEKQIQSSWIPSSMEANFFHNLLYLLLKVAFALLSAINIEVLGNVIRLQWTPIYTAPTEENECMRGDAMMKNYTSANNNLDFEEIERAVSDALKNDQRSWLPESLRRVVLAAIYSCILILTEEILHSSKIKLVTEELTLQLQHRPSDEDA